ncbi:MAG TPA: EamA family transporter RarD [Acidimicrobiia bacterium]|nr:EamA family transporter RarD [Acidimicrobiia bacterium]
MDRNRVGIISGLAAYVLWGLLTIYWKELSGLNAFGLIGQRVFWAVLFLGTILLLTGHTAELRSALRRRPLVLRAAGAAALLAVNWTSYVWAVTHDNVIETALGYFLAPLGTIALGVFVLRERLRPPQRVAITLAVGAVVLLGAGYGRVPWLALAIAISWSSYGLLKKTVPLGPRSSLMLELIVLLPCALIVIAVVNLAGDGVVAQASTTQLVLLPLTGVVTAVPLLLFAAAAHRIPLTTLGPLQYAVPAINFVLGVAFYDESMPTWRLAGFVLVWIALVVFTVDGVRAARSGAPPSASELKAVPLEG